MKSEIRKLITYSELSDAWQAEARSNNESDYDCVTYIEPLPHQVPTQHILFDLSECMRCEHSKEFDGVISCTNTSAIGIKLLEDDTCEMFYL